MNLVLIAVRRNTGLWLYIKAITYLVRIDIHYATYSMPIHYHSWGFNIIYMVRIDMHFVMYNMVYTCTFMALAPIQQYNETMSVVMLVI